ncbi:MAG: cob(I)yrinic acid a,c-diamide adenosyltransferase [Akkermansiaceae bacterium]
MSICTKRGDEGVTDLMFGRRIGKTEVRVEACGAVDELNAVLGIVRNAEISGEMEEWVDDVQQRLVGLMGVIATHEEDHGKYAEKGYRGIEASDVEWLEEIISDAEYEKGISFRGWARPGKDGKLASAYLDLARTVCRRAERACWAVEDDALGMARLFLNRLSDSLWLVAREASVSGG